MDPALTRKSSDGAADAPEVRAATAEPTVEAIVHHLRDAASRSRGHRERRAWLHADLDEIPALLAVAEEHAVLTPAQRLIVPPARFDGRSLLAFPRYWAARLIFRLTRLITTPQTIYNEQILQALRTLTHGVSAIEADVRQIKTTLTTHGAESRRRAALVDDSLADLRERISPTQRDPLANPSSTAAATMLPDTLAAALTAEFRGSRSEIKGRARNYLSLVRDVGAGSGSAPVLDLGCGRGEWLELLAEEGLIGRGVESNRVLVGECRARALDVEVGDALVYLRSQGGASAGAVTALHVIEHMPFTRVVQLIDEALRVLRPGGLLILETPNPESWLVSGYTFHLDPTHVQLLPSPVMKFIATACGLVDVHILHSQAPPIPEDAAAWPEPVRAHLYAPQDYAVVGRRP